MVLNAEERIAEGERRLFRELVERVGAQSTALLRTAQAIARVDVASALAETASRNRYVRPTFTEEPLLEIRGGRHPVVEQFLEQPYIPNDLVMDASSRIHIITGPNMSGKSSCLRQAALIVILAQMGSFVPADSAQIGLVDRIFTRIGASDDLASGQSTFMVEMVEAANILNHATPRSLLILDEVGRGTSTYDGMAIAWAVVEYLHNHPRRRARTLFAPYTSWSSWKTTAQVRNFNLAVAERGRDHLWPRYRPRGEDPPKGSMFAIGQFPWAGHHRPRALGTTWKRGIPPGTGNPEGGSRPNRGVITPREESRGETPPGELKG